MRDFDKMFEELFKGANPIERPSAQLYQQGIARGFEIARNHIADKLEAEGKGQSARWVRLLKLQRKGAP